MHVECLVSSAVIMQYITSMYMKTSEYIRAAGRRRRKWSVRCDVLKWRSEFLRLCNVNKKEFN